MKSHKIKKVVYFLYYFSIKIISKSNLSTACLSIIFFRHKLTNFLIKLNVFTPVLINSRIQIKSWHFLQFPCSTCRQNLNLEPKKWLRLRYIFPPRQLHLVTLN